MDDVRLADWVDEARQRFTDTNEYLLRAVDLAWMLTQALSQMVSTEQIELQDINIDNVLVFVERPQAQALNDILCNTVLCNTDPSVPSSSSLSIKGVNFQCEPPLPHAKREPINMRALCVALGGILLEIFSPKVETNTQQFSIDVDPLACNDSFDTTCMAPAGKRMASMPFDRPLPNGANIPMAGSDLPQSVCQLVGDLLSAGDKKSSSDASALTSLEEALFELTQMKNRPERYLFDRTCPQKALGDTCLFGESNDEQMIFGRQKEMNALMSAMLRISTHVAPNETSGYATNNGNPAVDEHSLRCEALVLSGYPGSGKSTVLRPLIQSCNMDNWFVIECKFDKQVAPVATLAKAFDDFFGLWAALGHQSDSKFDEVCHFIFDAMDMEAFHELCEQIPNLSLVFPKIFPFLAARANRPAGRRPSMEMVGSASNKRLHLFRMLFAALCCSGRQVLVVYDDLQWSDPFVLECLAELGLQKEECRRGMLVVGSYRSNELAEDSDILQEINVMRQSRNVNVSMLPIDDMSTDDINDMICSRLCMQRRCTRELAALVQSKTKGNPFHAVQFLKTILSNKMLDFSVKSRRWEWDRDVIDMQMISAGVAELVVSTFDQLPPPLIKTVRLVSCFGAQVSLSTLEAVKAGQHCFSFDLHNELRKAVQESILERAGPIYQFTHDLVQSAIYEAIPDFGRTLLHKTIGMNLLQSAADNPTIHLLATDQLNLFCKSGTPSPEERSRFAEINATAAKYAIAASSFEQARSYVDTGIQLLDGGLWETQYPQTLELFELCASVSCMQGDVVSMEKCLSELISHTKKVEDSLTSSFLLCKLLAANAKHSEAMSNGFAVLKGLGEEFPEDVNMPRVVTELKSVLPTLRDITSDQIRSLPEMSDPSKLEAMKFLSMMCMYSNISKPMLLPILSHRMVKLTLQYGRCDDSIVGIVMAGHGVLLLMEDVRLSYHVSKVVEPLIEESSNRNALRARCSGFQNGSKVIIEPAQALIGRLPTLYRTALLAGDMESAMKCFQHYCTGLFNTGSQLELVTKHLVDCIHQASNCQQNSAMYVAMSFLHACAYLSGTSIDIPVKSYEELHAIGQETNNRVLLHNNINNQMSDSFWLGDYQSVESLSQSVHTAGLKRITRFGRIVFEGISSLILARTTRDDIESRRTVGEKALEYMTQMIDTSKWNFENKSLLLQAELHYLNGELESADAAYEASIKSARDHKFLHEEALAYELHGNFCIENLRFDQGVEQIKVALERYKQWGANRKVADLQLVVNAYDGLGD